MLEPAKLISDRSGLLEASGIRRVFELGATLEDPINLSIGQPDFEVPKPVRQAAIDAIESGKNGYSMTTGEAALVERCREQVSCELGWPVEGEDAVGIAVTSGTSGALFLMNMALLSAGDEIIIPDPYFVAYPHMATFAGGNAVRCDIYPDFRMTAERIEPLITERTKAVLLNSPGNPTGVVLTQDECRDVLDLCRSKGVVLVSDEIYDEFCFDDGREAFGDKMLCPSPCREPGSEHDTLLIRGFGKTYGCTGWRLGYIAGPKWLIGEMSKLQQYSYVCAPTPLQLGCVETFDVSIDAALADYSERRDMVMELLGDIAEISRPAGAFYAYVKIPESLGMAGQDLLEEAVKRNVVIIPGNVFSERDTHFRISYATKKDRLREGLEILRAILTGH